MNIQASSAGIGDNRAHWDERVDLACAFRWAVRYNMHEGVANHFSLAVSDDGSQFLLNPNATHFSRVRAGGLLLVDGNDTETMSRPNAPDETAWCLHGAIHRNVPEARCILHTHSKYALALACLEDSTLPPIDQNSMRYFNRVAIDDGFNGLGLDEEAERVSRTMRGGKPVLVMGNHGIMVVGPTVALAFDMLFYFERACETYITALSTGKPLRVASDDVAEKTARQWESYPNVAENHFFALRDILDEEEPDYRT
ncbi:MAG: hypothetical protein HOH04_04950 [Rhodospirillaceae bacterium]|nr:hypothetical protein [Rhodospirillaceae bacterium]